VRALAASTHGDEIFAAVLPGSSLEKVAMPHLHPITVRVDYEWHPWGELYLDFGLRKLAERLGADVYLGPAFLIPTHKTPYAKIVTIHDLTVFEYPDAYPREFAYYLRWAISRSVKAADVVLCTTRFVEQQIAARWPQHAAKCRVIPLGIDEYFYRPVVPRREAGELPRDFILTVGAGNPRKNALFGAQIVKHMREQHGLPYEYVVVGKDASLPAWVRQFPPLPKERLPEFYSKAALLLVPSISEGFGLPVVEALACGCPVAVSDRGALPEVAGEAAALIFPLERNPAEIAPALAELLRRPDTVSALREKGKAWAEKFRLGAIAHQYHELFVSLTAKDKVHHAS
jgi:glycosyltransferase involved in cell wall biosynthesis